MELFLAGVLMGSYPGSAIYGKQSSSKLKYSNGGSSKHLELVEENMWHGFLSIAWLDDARRLGIITC